MIEEARALYAVAPAEFVAERNRLVKELKAAGRADDAAAVAALRKPRVSEHALNLVAHDDPAVVRRFADAAGAAMDAQASAIGGGGADALRTANRELRSVSVELIDAAVARLEEHGRGGAGQRDEIEEVLRSLTSESGRDVLVAGVLGAAPIGGDELFAGAPEVAGSRPATPDVPAARGRAAQSSRATRAGTDRADRRGEKAVEAERTRHAAERRRRDVERTRATRAVREAESHEAAVERELDTLRRRLVDVERRVAESEDALESARAAADAARADLAALDRQQRTGERR